MEEKIQFRNTKGRKLVGIINKPDGDGPFPAVLNCHGFTATKDEKFHPGLSKELCNAGFVALRFDFTGNGESEGEFSDGNIAQEVKDVKKAIDFLENLDYVDKNKIGVAGHSMGGAVVIIAASQDERIKAIALLSPGVLFANYIKVRFGDALPEIKSKGYFLYRQERRDGTVKAFKITKDVLDITTNMDMFEIVRNIKRPVLVVYGTNDSNPGTSLEAMERLFKLANEPKELFLVKGVDHSYREKENVMTGKVVDFFKKYLKE